MVSLQERFRQQYGKQGIYAGSSHFHDYWCRDSMFAALGALSLGDHAIVRSTINMFLDNLSTDGHVPLRIGSKNQVLNYLHLPAGYGVHHNQDKGKNQSYDGNSLLLIVAEKYERLTGNMLDRKKLQRALQWNIHNEVNHLLHEGPYSSWEDSVKHTGARLYTNVCYYRSLLAAAYLFKDKKYAAKAAKTKKEIQRWWKKNYFSDGRKKQCMVAGNLLAIVWGITTKEQSKAILKHIAKRDTVCPPAGFWKPTRKDVYVPFFFVGLSDYHGMMEWSWLASIEIAAYRVSEQKEEADKRAKAVLHLINKYGSFYEVYDKDAPVKRLIYRSESDFSWGLGLLIASRPSSVSILQ
jgi:hypothetical protein